MVFTDVGIETVMMVEQPEYALFGIDVSWLVMVISVQLPHDEQLSQGQQVVDSRLAAEEVNKEEKY